MSSNERHNELRNTCSHASQEEIEKEVYSLDGESGICPWCNGTGCMPSEPTKTKSELDKRQGCPRKPSSIQSETNSRLEDMKCKGSVQTQKHRPPQNSLPQPVSASASASTSASAPVQCSHQSFQYSYPLAQSFYPSLQNMCLPLQYTFPMNQCSSPCAPLLHFSIPAFPTIPPSFSPVSQQPQAPVCSDPAHLLLSLSQLQSQQPPNAIQQESNAIPQESNAIQQETKENRSNAKQTNCDNCGKRKTSNAEQEKSASKPSIHFKLPDLPSKKPKVNEEWRDKCGNCARSSF